MGDTSNRHAEIAQRIAPNQLLVFMVSSLMRQALMRFGVERLLSFIVEKGRSRLDCRTLPLKSSYSALLKDSNQAIP